MNTKQLRQKILDLAIRGKLVPQDPNDEPASALLERIRNEKERLVKDKKIKPDKQDAGSDKSPYQKSPFEVPESWVWCRLGDLCNYGICNNVNSTDIANNAWILDLEDIEKDTAKLLQRVKKVDRKTTSTRHFFVAGNVLYSKLRTYLNKVLVADEDGFCTTEILPLDFKGYVIPEYARRVLMSQMFLDYTEQCGYGVKMPRLGTTDGQKAPFPLPPLAEQRRIVSVIESAFALIDKIEESKTSLKQIIKQAKAKTLELAIKGKLLPQTTADNSPYPDLPEGWKRVKLEEVGQVVTGSTPSKSNPNFYGNDYPFFKPTDLDAGLNTIKASDNLSKAGFEVSRKLPKNSILVCCIGTIGKIGMIQVDGTCNQQINAIIPNQTIILPSFLFYLCHSNDVQKQLWDNSSATTIAILNKGNFEKTVIPLPPLSEQQLIVAQIETIFAQLDAIEKELKI